MREICFGFSRARVWWNEPCGLSMAPLETLTATETAAAAGGNHRVARVTLELFVPLGGHFLYGLLGAQLEPDASSELLIRVPTSSMDGRAYSDSLAAAVDDVRAGLPAEYGGSVLGALREQAPTLLPGGKLAVTEAAHGVVGSSGSMFCRLAGLVCRLIASGPMDDAALQQLLGSTV